MGVHVFGAVVQNAPLPSCFLFGVCAGIRSTMRATDSEWKEGNVRQYLVQVAAVSLLFSLLAPGCYAQGAGHVGLPIDWSFHHIASHEVVDPASERIARQEPRVVYNVLQRSRARHAHAVGPLPRAVHGNRPITDWHVTLGSGTVAANMSPAKFTFNDNAAPSCANDYAVFGLNVAGSSTQPNLVGFTNLYSGVIGSTFTISSATESGTTVTIVTSTANTFATGEYVTVAGVSPAGYNGTFQITTVSATTFTYTDVSGLGTGSTTGATAVQSGYCGVAPTVQWAYNVSTASGTILTSPALSTDGTGIAFIESASSGAVFHVLTIGTTGFNGTFIAALNEYFAAQPDNTGAINNATLQSVTYSTVANTRSSPFVDYNNDVAYFGDDNGNLYRTNCVFLCAAHGLTLGIAAGWPVNVAPAGTKMSPPVADSTSGKIFVGGSNGVLYMVPLATCPGSGCAIGNATVGFNGPNGAVIDGVLLDTTFQTLFVTAGRGSSGTNAAGNAVQLNESMTRLATISMNANAYDLANGTLDDAYYNNSIGSATVSGNGYFCGPVSGSGQAGIFTVGFSATGPLSLTNPPIMSGSSSLNIPGNPSVACNPLLSFADGTIERLFFSQSTLPRTGCNGASATDGCLFSYTIGATGNISFSASTSEHGGTSGIIVDNAANLPQASSLYFATQSTATGSTSSPSCTYTLSNAPAFCAVKVTQSGLQ